MAKKNDIIEVEIPVEVMDDIIALNDVLSPVEEQNDKASITAPEKPKQALKPLKYALGDKVKLGDSICDIINIYGGKDKPYEVGILNKQSYGLFAERELKPFM